jgi:hypothetical protein
MNSLQQRHILSHGQVAGQLQNNGRTVLRNVDDQVESLAITRPSGLNRQHWRELTRRLRSDDPGLDVMHPNAAEIDDGNSAHYVAVRPERDPDPVRRFHCFTADLHRLAD